MVDCGCCCCCCCWGLCGGYAVRGTIVSRLVLYSRKVVGWLDFYSFTCSGRPVRVVEGERGTENR